MNRIVLLGLVFLGACASARGFDMKGALKADGTCSVTTPTESRTDGVLRVERDEVDLQTPEIRRIVFFCILGAQSMDSPRFLLGLNYPASQEFPVAGVYEVVYNTWGKLNKAGVATDFLGGKPTQWRWEGHSGTLTILKADGNGVEATFNVKIGRRGLDI